MNRRQAIACSLAAASLLLSSCAVTKPTHIHEADYPGVIRVACVGDSITFGHLILNRATNSYPAQLAARLGPKWEVRNFGMNGATALKQGTRPYWTQQVFKDAVAFNPDVVILQLGTNDTAPPNWQAHGAEFGGDFAALLQQFATLPARPRLYVCRPVPIYRDRGKEWDTGKILLEQIIPQIDQAAGKARAPVIDLHTALDGQPALFPDGVHPNAAGAKLIAEAVYTALTGRK
jgi:acyl-CoA thioesterase-1